MLVLRPEGEIAAVNMVAGASLAGARAMTSTSGGGFCLMSEGLGMLGMTETPRHHGSSKAWAEYWSANLLSPG